MKKLNAKELRKTKPSQTNLEKIKRNPVYFVLDKIYDTYNIGSIFRLADACAIKKMYLCGDMEYPPNSRIHKAAVGTEEWVPWEHNASAIKTVHQLKSQGIQIVAVEQDKRSILLRNLKMNFPCAIVVGNESAGINKKILDAADVIVELPMYGVNKSFNVWGSLAVVTYNILSTLSL